MEKIVKILHINTGLVAGGVERLLNDLLPLFNKEKRVQADLFLLENKGNNLFEEELKKNNVKIIYSKYNNKFDIRNIFEIKKLIKNYDVVHTHIFPSQFYLPLAIIGLKNKPYLITTEHNTNNNRRKHKILSKIEKYLYLKYDKIISISNETEIELKKWLKIEYGYKNKFQVIENGININKFYLSDKNIEDNFFKEKRKNRIITMIGRFNIQKDQPTLIRAIKNINDAYLFLVGDGERKKEYQNLVKELNIENKVKFLGVRNDIPKILKITDICVLSSNWEGFGLVAIESMAAGKPVIASNVDGLKQIIEGNGLIFEKGNEDDLEEKIRFLLNDKEEYKKMCEKCLKKAKEYDIQKMAEKYLDNYFNFLKKRDIKNEK